VLEVEPSETIENVKANIKDKKEFLLMSKDWSLLANNWKMDVLWQIVTVKKNLPFILCWDFVVVLRKKSSYTTPKNNKQNRKKVKLAVLKYYTVNENVKISCLHPECPSDKCVAIVFMASHFSDITVASVVYLLLQ
jgi:small subunit ribosomal protein S27Ae